MEIPILDLKFYSNDLNKEVTIREFFYELMKALWEEGEQFSGKYPLGNSDWDGDLIICLIENKLISGSLDEDGYLDKWNDNEIKTFVLKNIINPIFNQK